VTGAGCAHDDGDATTRIKTVPPPATCRRRRRTRWDGATDALWQIRFPVWVGASLTVRGDETGAGPGHRCVPDAACRQRDEVAHQTGASNRTNPKLPRARQEPCPTRRLVGNSYD